MAISDQNLKQYQLRKLMEAQRKYNNRQNWYNKHSSLAQYYDVDIIEEIRIRKSKKDRQRNDQKEKYKRANNDLQNNTHKTKDRATRTSLKTGRMHRSYYSSGTRRVNHVTKPMTSPE